MLEGVITGVSVGVIMVGINSIINHRKERKRELESKYKAAIQLLLKCMLVVLSAMKKEGIINGDCNEVLQELNEFLITK